ncbi:Pycsar system effector family protein [Roseivirga sp. E12]|uniref:Pycsar system effector family protein n=1 Tax=Roseivirga sp. E12 TaxID=2819237 RepID=UPI001ABD1C23|nr:Pycsar system effector family protein [Roseivirga sp. E12]MBO3699971.1 hypothetical protein [Roseivirga sp. E12]
MSENKESQKLQNTLIMEELGIDKKKLNELMKKLSKVAPRAERGTETLFRLTSKNHYTLNTMVDRKANIMISINAIILSIMIGTVMNQLDADPHLVYPLILITLTNIVAITYAVLATRPDLSHGTDHEASGLLFYGNFQDIDERTYVSGMQKLMYGGDDLYDAISKDIYHLGKRLKVKFGYLRKAFNIFAIGISLSVIAFILCHIFFS